jgi:hypothetical protein
LKPALHQRQPAIDAEITPVGDKSFNVLQQTIW